MPRINVKDKRKQQLIEANIASIAKRGLAETTIAHVSKGAGMSRGIVNFYFTSKEKMMQETLAFLVQEMTGAWMATFQEEREKKSTAPHMLEAVLRTLMGDRLCTPKRMAVWTAFLGYSACHAPSARMIRAMDEAFTLQLKTVWHDAGYDPDAADMHAWRLLALIRGHWLQSALGDEARRPSYYIDALLEWLHSEAAARNKRIQVKPTKSKAVGKPVQSTADQLDFGSLLEAKTGGI